MKKGTSKGQVIELVRQCGSGELGYDLAQALIEKRVVIASPVSVREGQARVLFDKFGAVLGCTTFDQYLNAEGRDSFEPVPQMPDWPARNVRLFGRESVCLVDRRVVKRIGLKEYCKLAGIRYYCQDDTLEPVDPKQVKEGIYWMLYQDGYRNRNRKSLDCRDGFLSFEVGMSEVEGVSVYVQNSGVIDGHVMELPGSVHREHSDRFAYIGFLHEGPTLGWSWGNLAEPYAGAASRSV